MIPTEVKSPVHYYGKKRPLAPRIIKRFPGYGNYREPFAGVMVAPVCTSKDSGKECGRELATGGMVSEDLN